MNYEPHTGAGTMQFATISEYLRSIGRSRATLSQWLNGRQLDPWGDPVITNRAILGGCRKNIAEDPDRLGDFKDFLHEWAVASRRKWPVPDYIEAGLNRGSEEVTADDLLTTEVRGRDGSCYRLWSKNREWLHVFVEDGGESRLHVDVVDEATVPKALALPPPFRGLPPPVNSEAFPQIVDLRGLELWEKNNDHYWPITNALELWADKTTEHKWADDIA